MAHANERVLDDLRARIASIEHAGRPDRGVVPFGVREVDTRLPPGGLARGALHEVGGGGVGAVHGAAAVLFAAGLFAAGVFARMPGSVLLCLRARDLFAPALAGTGLHPDRVIYAETGDDLRGGPG